MNNLNFVQVPMSALIKLNDINLKIYGIIYTSCKLNNNKFYHSYQQFADELCVSIRNIKYSVKYLANNGYIEIERGRGIKKPNIYHIPNGAMDCTINLSNGATGCTINGAMDCTQKENKEKIEKKKEKEIYKENEKRKSVTKDTSNLQVLPDNENNNNNKIKLTMSKQNTKNPENGNTPNNLESFRPSENTNPNSDETNNGNPNEISHCFFDSGSEYDKPNSLQIQASGQDNTKNGDNPNKAEMNNPNTIRPTTAGQNTNPNTALNSPKVSGATETVHRGFNGTQVDNYPTHSEKTSQEANNEGNRDTHSPMNGYIPIDELEDIYNGGQTIPKPQSKASTPIQPTEEDVRYLTISKWNQTMRNIKTKVETDTKLNQSDLQALLEGSQDPMRVIDTLKTIKMLINNFIRLKCYWRFLDECEITIPTIRSEKQRKYAKDLLKECDKDYDNYRNMLKKII